MKYSFMAIVYIVFAFIGFILLLAVEYDVGLVVFVQTSVILFYCAQIDKRMYKLSEDRKETEKLKLPKEWDVDPLQGNDEVER